MFRFLLTLFLGLIGLNFGWSQLLNNSLGEAFTDEPFFNIENVCENRIKRITGHYSMKKMNDQVRPSKLIYVYEFDDWGRLVQKYETVAVGSGVDTVVTHYEYDAMGFLHVKRKSDRDGFNANVYTNDNQGRVIKEEYRKDINKTADKTNFILDHKYLITYETSTYENYDRQEKRIYYNSYGKPFQEKISYFDKDGYLLEEVEKLRVTSGQKRTTYSYNPKGLLDTMEVVSTIMGNTTIKYVFTYDERNNLLSKQIHRNGEYTTEIQVVYSEKTGLISAILTRQVSTNFITILRLDEYEFYD
jgi:hypothetical protein